jgi:glycosyltransferase involved in cell wall biosynthesis
VLVDGPSQLEFLVRDGMIDRRKATVIGHGSIAGVDTSRFRPDPEVRSALRRELGISPSALVVCFVGRVKREKGFHDLVEAVRLLRMELPVVLLAVGEDEDELIPGAAAVLGDSLCFVGQVSAVEKYLACSDVFALPSYREGFGLSVIEASATELPVVVSDIYGLADSLVIGVTGLSVPPKEPSALAETLRVLLLDPQTSREYGIAGRQRVEREFRQDQVVAAYVTYVTELVEADPRG